MKGALLVLAGAEAADVLTSIWAQAHGTREGNVLFAGNLAWLIISKLLLVLAVWGLLEAVRSSKLAPTVSGTFLFFSGVVAAVAAHNVLLVVSPGN